ncbi:hypothetical protein [Lichenicoccus sp.]|uniref:hypothetical protein n=1 Tax=Lichenicoccus sp. TaxID=2781899 RepID=UPI003D0B8720
MTSRHLQILMIILGILLAAEAVLPWTLIGITRLFAFTIPPESVWLIFSMPILLTVLASVRTLVFVSRPQARG